MDPSLENLKCPKCGGPMVSRLNKKEQSRFWGCKGFPKCDGTRDVEGRDWNEKHKEKLENKDHTY